MLFFFFPEKTHFVHYHNIPDLLQELGILLYSSTDWRLFLEKSNCKLKHILTNGDVYEAVLVGHAMHLQEEYNNIKMAVDQLK